MCCVVLGMKQTKGEKSKELGLYLSIYMLTYITIYRDMNYSFIFTRVFSFTFLLTVNDKVDAISL